MKKTKTVDPVILDDTSESHLTKNEIIQILREENPPVDDDNRFNQLFLIVEFKKINLHVGIIKGELYNNDQLDYRGSLLMPLMRSDTDQKNQWDSIEVGRSVYYGLSFDARELCITEKIGEFLHRSIDEGKLQDFIPFTGGK
jgi:hypothetical protein